MTDSRITESDQSSSIAGLGRPCTDGDWPCEMSTHLCFLEAENLRLKSLLADIKQWDVSQAGETFRKTGKAMELVIPLPLRKRIHSIL
jgi:hypothetical protein